MSQTKHPCERCGAEALVHITNDEASGPIVRHLCLDCAEEEAVTARGEPQLNHAIILIAVGLLTLVVSAAADVLKFGEAEEFGVWQRLGILLGGVLLFIGALTRVSTLVVIGLITCVLTLLADWLGFGNAEGFGVQQIVGCLLGVSMIAAGLALGRRRA